MGDVDEKVGEVNEKVAAAPRSSARRRPRLLDLFCCAGGAAMGYHRAGFDVVGVDINPQPRYPFEFYQADALKFPFDGFDVIHASPPCQAYSHSRNARPHATVKHPALIEPARARLVASGLPYVIENVIGAPLHAPIVLCGTMFELQAADDDGETLFLRRHRLFESNCWLTIPCACRCADLKARGLKVGGAYGGGPKNRDKVRNRKWGRGGYTPRKAVRLELLGLKPDSMTLYESAQAIPPCFTEWIGAQLLAALEIAA